MLKLLPFSIEELAGHYDIASINKLLITGFYPRIYGGDSTQMRSDMLIYPVTGVHTMLHLIENKSGNHVFIAGLILLSFFCSPQFLVIILQQKSLLFYIKKQVSETLQLSHLVFFKGTLSSSEFGQASVSSNNLTFFPISIPHSGQLWFFNLKAYAPQQPGQ